MSKFDKNGQKRFEKEILARKWRNVIKMLRSESKNKVENPLTGNLPFFQTLVTNSQEFTWLISKSYSKIGEKFKCFNRSYFDPF